MAADEKHGDVGILSSGIRPCFQIHQEWGITMAVPGSITGRTGGETNTLGLFLSLWDSWAPFPLRVQVRGSCEIYMAGAPERAQTRGRLTAENGGMCGLTLHQVV